MLFTFCSWILRFRDLQNYTTLKHLCKWAFPIFCLRDLQNYTVNVNIRMYNFDDVQCTVIPSVAYSFVSGMNQQLCLSHMGMVK